MQIHRRIAGHGMETLQHAWRHAGSFGRQVERVAADRPVGQEDFGGGRFPRAAIGVLERQHEVRGLGFGRPASRQYGDYVEYHGGLSKPAPVQLLLRFERGRILILSFGVGSSSLPAPYLN